MDKVNYQLVLDETLREVERQDGVKRLLLHSCCAPCSSYCLEYLSEYFEITVFYYNPNIYPEEEFYFRASEQERFISELESKNKISFIQGEYDKDRFYEIAKGLESEPERGKRCHKCYELRLREAGLLAKKLGFDYFTTTLSISPQKDAAKLNEIGGKLASEIGVSYLFSDFKKKNGYLRSTEISKEHGMYRQNYCGCVYSMRD